MIILDGYSKHHPTFCAVNLTPFQQKPMLSL